ncbi:Mitochondrial inner-membrane-bound regulator domain containing protein [Naviculisporaceae sp. PSN 640]
MLRRQVSGGFICLRCRLQQANAISRPGAPLFHRVASSPVSTIYAQRLAQGRTHQLYSTSNAPNRREEDTDPFASLSAQAAPDRPGQQDVPKSDETRPWASEPAVPNENIELEPRYKRSLVSSLRSVYKARGEHFIAEKEAVPAEVLGKPASALVMRGRGRTKKKNGKVVVMDAADLSLEGGGMSLFQQLNQETSEPKADEISSNIDCLRPSEKTVFQRDFEAIIEKLEKGFTKDQLTTYLLRFREDRSLSPYPARLPTDPSWILERQPWIAAVENPDESVEPILYGYNKPGRPDDRMSAKEKLARLVMRECWGISCYEVLDQDGYLSVKLRKHEFALLLLGHATWLSDIARSSPELGTQIVVSPSIETVSILSKPHTTELILSKINQTLEKAITASFSASILPPDALEPAVLEEVGQITKAIVRLDTTSQQVLVTWIPGPGTPAKQGWESLGDVVLRYLLHAPDRGTRTTSSLIVLPQTDKRRGRYVAEQNSERKMLWMDRLHKWARYVQPAAEGPSEDATDELQTVELYEIPTELLEHPLDIENRNEMRFDRDPRPSLYKTPVAPGWATRITTDTRAVFGHVLHAERPGSSLPLVSKTTALDSSRRRTFTPVHPPLRSLKFENNLKETGLYHAIIVLRFLPSAEQSTAAPAIASAAPPLELRIEIDHKEVKRIVSLRAVVGTHTSDVMIPSYPVDVRLLQTSYAELTGRSIDEFAAPVLDFLDQSKIEPWDGKLENPARLDGLDIPKHLFLQQSGRDTTSANKLIDDAADEHNNTNSPSATGEAKEKETKSDTTHKIDYLFVSREIHRLVAAEYDGYKVSYWNINAGKLGGQTTQLSLDAICPNSAEMGENSIYRKPETFLKAVSQIASGENGFQWLGNSPDKYIQHL